MMKQLQSINISLPYDITFRIASSLSVRDVCALGSCSKFWRELCGSDPIWVSLSKQRWPSLHFSDENFPISDSISQPLFMGWKAFYMNRHQETAGKASSIIKFVEQCSSSVSLEVRDYLKAIEELCSTGLDFKDVELFLFKPELNVFLNLIGLHYCINWLGVPAENVINALEYSKISEKQVSIKWWKLGRWFYGFRLRDESHYRVVSLADLAIHKHEVLELLYRGAVYEVIRIQISIPYPLSTPWTCQSSVSN